ncbi:RNA polymerase sigma factor [Halalkalibacter urbisdiaboli]|uniref:RNA polymerase sigma factor n=1 Tax=Halalkalibacter urbisdiaboli TaxID=1960589 RepID=UPI0013FE0711|nr:sigma-70 family RNA polymerase sigma factor [Halalkalibacter urbisdiaboli]
MNTDAALQQILEEKTKTIYKYLIKVGANPRDAEDIVQESVYKYILYMDSIETSKVYSWLFRVAINQYYDLCRKQNRQIRISFEHVDLIDDEPLPIDYIQQQELREDINQVMHQLKPVYRQLLFLKYELELSYEEIADLLDLKRATLKTYLFRARETFKEIYRREAKHD